MSAATPPDSPLTVILPDPDATAALGARLAGAARVGDILCLAGPLGAGKTSLARGFLRAWTADSALEAPSPTFTLVQTYDSARGCVWHMDLYRLENPDSALDLGLEDALEDAVLLIEWPERLGPLLPAQRLDIALSPTAEGRVAFIAGHGAAGARLAAALKGSHDVA